jgi:TBC domain-containing protein kinase-like protein
MDPSLSEHLIKIGLDPDLYAVSWFLNLFSMVFQYEDTIRIWDLYLLNPFIK